MNDLGAVIRDHLTVECCEVDCWCRECDARTDALAEVLRLHERLESGMGYRDVAFDGYGEIMGVCAACGKPDEYAVVWPCPTVRALADALGVPLE